LVYRLSAAARVSFRVDRARRGRVVNGHCRRQTARNRRGRPCTVWRRVGSFSQQGRRGNNRRRFSGRVGRRTLSPGSYRFMAQATTRRGNRSIRVARRFRVVRG
nr:hypothetical protein [Actinomycetota bacterium]